MNSVEKFLDDHKLLASTFSMQSLVDDFNVEMLNGLQGKDSSLRMIPTYIEADNEFATEVPVVAIDAGGTNFRAALTKFNKHGKLVISDVQNFRMPGIDGEVTIAEFFKIIVGYIQNYAEKAERIGFCFSYPTEIMKNKDGVLLQFCKEVQAPEVVGQLIGQNLLEALGMPSKPIVLLNDTVATLLAGKSASFGKSYDSFIGFILGTGTNTCYIESNEELIKVNGLNVTYSQIVNIESGNFSKAPRTDIDLIFDSKTSNPGNYTFEKMFSGGYLGGLCLTALKTAGQENVFSPESRQIHDIKELSTEVVNNYLIGHASENVLERIFSNVNDAQNCRRIIEALIERAAKLAASNIAAVILKTNKGKSIEKPILITVEGTTFYKLNKLKDQFEYFLGNYLSGEKKRYFKLTQVEQSSLTGAALAALIE